jgi:hypothetical protein
MSHKDFGCTATDAFLGSIASPHGESRASFWQHSIPTDRDPQEHLAGLDLTDDSQLSSVDDLLDTFPDLPTHKHLHIIVKPHPGE